MKFLSILTAFLTVSMYGMDGKGQQQTVMYADPGDGFPWAPVLGLVGVLVTACVTAWGIMRKGKMHDD